MDSAAKVADYYKMLGRWPWAVRLRYPNDRDKNRRCGGALIARNLVLTAAHCLHGSIAEELEVVVGDVHVSLHDGSEYSIPVKEIVRHHMYHHRFVRINHCGRFAENAAVSVHDIALLILRDDAACSNTILLPWHNRTLSVFSRQFPETMKFNRQSRCFVAGWGFVSAVGPNSDMIREADVTVIEPHLCNSSCLYSGNIFDGMVCAMGDVRRRQDACTGDSGGPLMCLKDGIWLLAGIVNWGLGCGELLKPGVYADPGFYQQWLLNELIKRPKEETRFWNGIIQCKSSVVQIRECRDPWNAQHLRQIGIFCQ